MLLTDLLLVFVTLITLLVIVAGLWCPFLGVPFVPTSTAIAKSMIDLVDWTEVRHVVDLGAGDGRLLASVKKRHESVRVTGYELSPVVWMLGIIRMAITRNGVRLHLQSLFRADLTDVDVVFLYLFPSIMDKLQAKLDRELRPGTIVVAQTFGFPQKIPQKVICAQSFGGEISIFLYRWPAKGKEDVL